MLSKNRLKLIRQLSQKKFRQEKNLFVAEGEKVVHELLDSGWRANQIYTTDPLKNIPHTLVDQSELKKISNLSSVSSIIGVFHLPKYEFSYVNKGLSVALDSIADPGNLGTIIRLCDWFGIKNLFCSPNTVDCFNPKVVQSTMGSIARVQCHYVELLTLIDKCETKVYAATLDGSSLYKESFPTDGLLLMGSESHGINNELLAEIENRITIPTHSGGRGPESLNVASATAILLGEIFRSRAI
ncbi:MAG: RNA methyltransferase [Flavobacteriaceae bacterium]|nr:RNA methyltransferase [Bacteroidota bacterium]